MGFGRTSSGSCSVVGFGMNLRFLLPPC